MAGVPPFEIRDVQGPFSLYSEHMVRFEVLGHPVRLIGNSMDRATIAISSPDMEEPHTIIRAFVNPLGTTGALMTFNIESDFEIDTNNLKQALQTGLFSCIEADSEGFTSHPVLRKYRAKLKERKA